MEGKFKINEFFYALGGNISLLSDHVTIFYVNNLNLNQHQFLPICSIGTLPQNHAFFNVFFYCHYSSVIQAVERCEKIAPCKQGVLTKFL